MSADGARPSFVELIVQAVQKSVTLSTTEEQQLRTNLTAVLSKPFVDGNVITASYLNLVENRLRKLEQDIADLRKSGSKARFAERKPREPFTTGESE